MKFHQQWAMRERLETPIIEACYSFENEMQNLIVDSEFIFCCQSFQVKYFPSSSDYQRQSIVLYDEVI